MKTRATSFLLAALAVVSFVLPALAADFDELPEEAPAEGPVQNQLGGQHALLRGLHVDASVGHRGELHPPLAVEDHVQKVAKQL